MNNHIANHYADNMHGEPILDYNNNLLIGGDSPLPNNDPLSQLPDQENDIEDLGLGDIVGQNKQNYGGGAPYCLYDHQNNELF